MRSRSRIILTEKEPQRDLKFEKKSGHESGTFGGLKNLRQYLFNIIAPLVSLIGTTNGSTQSFHFFHPNL
jgi:hypothetical protein